MGVMFGDGYFNHDPDGLKRVQEWVDAGARVFRLPFYQRTLPTQTRDEPATMWSRTMDVYANRRDAWTLALMVAQAAYKPNDRAGTIDSFLQYVRAMAQEHKKAKRERIIYELWNEPDAVHPLSPPEFADVINRGIAIIREVWGERFGRDIFVCSGGVAGIDTDPRAFYHAAVTEMEKLPNRPHFFGFHTYRMDDSAHGVHTSRPEFLIDGPSRHLTLVAALRKLREELRSIGAEPLMTERDFGVRVNDDRLRMAYLTRLTLIHLGEGIGNVVWTVDMPRGSAHPGRLPAEAISIMKQMTSFFGEAMAKGSIVDWSDRIDGDAMSVAFQLRNEIRFAVWVPDGDLADNREVRLSVSGGYRSATLIDLQQTMYGVRDSSALSITNSSATVRVSAMPCLVRLRK